MSTHVFLYAVLNAFSIFPLFGTGSGGKEFLRVFLFDRLGVSKPLTKITNEKTIMVFKKKRQDESAEKKSETGVVQGQDLTPAGDEIGRDSKKK